MVECEGYFNAYLDTFCAVEKIQSAAGKENAQFGSEVIEVFKRKLLGKNKSKKTMHFYIPSVNDIQKRNMK